MGESIEPLGEKDLAEYQALLLGKGFVALADWTCISLRGEDRTTFLHSFCTNDVKALQVGGSSEAMILDVKGKVFGNVLVICCEEQLLLVTGPDQAAGLISHLDRYIIREDVQLSDVSAKNNCFVTTCADVVGIPGWSASCDWLRPATTMLLIVASEDCEQAVAKLEDAGMVSCGRKAFNAARIEAGTPWFGIDFSAANLPQEINRDQQTISFAKGCYLGQETVARIDAMGHVNQQICGVVFPDNSEPHPGLDLIFEEKSVGSLSSIAYSPKLKRPLGLAMVRRPLNKAGTRLDSNAGECEIVPLPVTTSELS